VGSLYNPVANSSLRVNDVSFKNGNLVVRLAITPNRTIPVITRG
jgi:hypothetical protein